MVVKFFIPGEPVAQGRPRATTINGRTRMYDAPKSATYKNMVSMVASQKMEGLALIEQAVSVVISVQKSVPQSWSKKKQASALADELKPTGKPDIDNYIKAVFDGLNGVVFKDDSQVVYIGATKRYSDTPGISVTVFDAEELP